jgi:hypothetical protein
MHCAVLAVPTSLAHDLGALAAGNAWMRRVVLVLVRDAGAVRVQPRLVADTVQTGELLADGVAPRAVPPCVATVSSCIVGDCLGRCRDTVTMGPQIPRRRLRPGLLFCLKEFKKPVSHTPTTLLQTFITI